MKQLDLYQQFKNDCQYKNKMDIHKQLSPILDYLEYSIVKLYHPSDKQKYNAKNRKNQINEQFVLALRSLNRQQKLQYFLKVMEYIKNFHNKVMKSPQSKYSGSLNETGFSRSYNLRMWTQKILRLDQDNHVIYAETKEKIKTYNLRDYIIRSSKNKEYFIFVLEAINANPQQKSRTVHLGFKDISSYELWIDRVKLSINIRQWQFYRKFFQKHLKQHISTNNKQQNSLSLSNVSLNSLTSTNKSQNSIYSSNNGQFKERNKKTEQSLYKSSRELGELQRGNKKNQQSLYATQRKKVEQDSPTSFKKVAKTQSLRQINLHNIVHEDQANQISKQKQKIENKLKQYKLKTQMNPVRKTYVQALVQGQVFEEPDVFEDVLEEQPEQSKKLKRNLDLFHKLNPQYQLQQLDVFLNFEVIHQEDDLKIYKNQYINRKKITIEFSKQKYDQKKIIQAISKIQLLKDINDNVQEASLKTLISSQNSAILYMILKPYNRLYRSRDFIFIRHVFRSGSTIYMVDKSIQNSNYPPFMTIVRGSLSNVYGIYEKQDKFHLIADIQMKNEGYLNQNQQDNLTIKFLKAFNKLKKCQIPQSSYQFFDINWDISKNQSNKIENQIRTIRKSLVVLNKRQSVSLNNIIQKSPSQQQNIKPIVNINHYKQEDENQYEKLNKSYEISPQKIKEEPKSPITPQVKQKISDNQNISQRIDRKLNNEGMVIIEPGYLKKKHMLTQLSSYQKKFNKSSIGHPIWKNQWKRDNNQGGMIFSDKKKLQDQKSVMSFIISKIAKNIISGNSIMNISLPVDILSQQSNLQKLLYAMSYGPLLLEDLQNEGSIQKLLKTFIFGLTNLVLYLNIEKPFNPIIGQTFQCWINGCPGYAEQISHHPPISALMFKGRGYQITAQVQSKANFGVSAVKGINEGIYRVNFSDNTQICFTLPEGQLSGLTSDERKFNCINKIHYWIQNRNIVLQVTYDPFKKGFFSIGKAQQPSDYFQGNIWEVKPEFMAKFVAGKRKQPEPKDRQKLIGKINGIWNKEIKFNNTQIFNFDRQFPFRMQFQAFPLPSDSNWREDIQYRKRNEIPRAQTQKERLQVLQRKDKKMRQKFNKKK